MKHFFLFVLLLTGLFITGCGDDPAASDTREISLGAVLALSGSLSDLGTTANAAIELAMEDVNLEMGEEVDLKSIVVKDSHTNPDSALAAFESLHEDDFHVIIGPQSSSATEQVKSYADANDIVVISPSSVARSLSVAGDNIFRLSPDDSYQAEAMTAMIIEDDLDALITVHREDVWGHDLVSLVTDLYTGQGKSVFDNLTYDPTGTDFSSLLGDLDARVQEAVSLYGAENVGVYLLSFGEAESILSQASGYPNLSAVKWYGASAIAQSTKLLNNATAAAFARTVGYPCPVFGLEESLRSKWEPLRARIKEATGQEADIYSLVAYDAVRLIIKNWLAVGNDDVEAFKEKLPETAASYTGVTGLMELNAAGDRKIGNYDFWAIRDAGNGPEWVRVAFYNSTTKVLSRN